MIRKELFIVTHANSSYYYHRKSAENSVKNIKLIYDGLRACLHGVGDPGLVGLVSFVFTLWGTQNKRNLPH